MHHDNWPFAFKVQSWQVWDAFIILSLLEYRRDQDLGALDVPHGGDQRERFRAATEERNSRIASFGQSELPHWCKKCTRLYDQRAIGGGIGA